MFHDGDVLGEYQSQETLRTRGACPVPCPDEPKIARGDEIEVAGIRFRLPMPGEEPLVIGSHVIRAIDLGDGAFMHEIRTVR